MESFRRRLHFLKNAVDAEPDAEFFVERLEMHIARAELVRFDEKHRDHANDRRVGFVGAANVAAFQDFETEIHVVADLLHQYIRRFVRGAVIFDQGLPDFLRTRADQLDFALEKEVQAIDRVDVERVAYRHDQSALAEADRNDFEAPRVRGGNLFDHFGRNHFRCEIDPIHMGLGRETSRNVRLRDDAFLHEQIDDVRRPVQFRSGVLDLRTRD